MFSGRTRYNLKIGGGQEPDRPVRRPCERPSHIRKIAHMFESVKKAPATRGFRTPETPWTPVTDRTYGS